jgi:CheY-like chemotaxis protein
LHAANEELKSLDEMKTNLLSNVSHELRTPLVAVMGYTDMIYNGKAGPVTESQKEYLGISLRNIDRLVTLIENLLDFSRMHRGAERIAFETFDLADCARKSMEVVRPVAESREIVLELEAPDEPVFVEGDNGKLSQVFTNLLSNAVKFNHTGGRVTVTLVLSEDTVEARVADTGIGMPPESLDKVFSRFYQLDSSSTRKYGGTGIGLSIAQDICRLHGTRLTVRSEVGKGSEFRFSLPLKRERGDDETASVASVDETELLVELVTRDRALCTQVRMLLDGENANVVIAGTIDNAVHLAERHQPDCLLVDREAGCVRDDVVDALAGHGPVDGGLVVYTSDDAAYARYSDRAAARLKPGFRKSALLSAISHAMGAHGAVASELGNGVLCVDDDPEIVGFITNLLEPEGFRVVGCASGAEALERVGSKDYGLVLLDIAMPGMDGWEACRRMKTDPALAGIRVYMVTAKPVSKYDSRAQEARPDGYLLKPFRPGDLLELVRTGASAPRSDDSQEGAES